MVSCMLHRMQLSYEQWFWLVLVISLIAGIFTRYLDRGGYFDRKLKEKRNSVNTEKEKGNSVKTELTWQERVDHLKNQERIQKFTWNDIAIIIMILCITVSILWFGAVINAFIFSGSFCLIACSIGYLVWFFNQLLHKMGFVKTQIIVSLERQDLKQARDLLEYTLLFIFLVTILIFLAFILLSIFISFLHVISIEMLAISGVITGFLLAVIIIAILITIE